MNLVLKRSSFVYAIFSIFSKTALPLFTNSLDFALFFSFFRSCLWINAFRKLASNYNAVSSDSGLENLFAIYVNCCFTPDLGDVMEAGRALALARGESTEEMDRAVSMFTSDIALQRSSILDVIE
jgi:hypothetical protein